MGSALYNEIEPFACEWLGNLIAGGHIAAGEVDARSIAELDAARLAGVVQAHFFAGIGGWSAALRLAGWPDDRAVWTASCPCQPFSSAGKRGGFDDERHLWPVLFALIRECRPAVLFGEQVASRDGLAWFDAVHADLEGAGYTVGAADLCAAGVGAPHIRQRLYFVAMADADGAGPQGRSERGDRADQRATWSSGVGAALADADRQRRDGESVQLRGRGPHEGLPKASRGGATGALELGHSDEQGTRRHGGSGDRAEGRGWDVASGDSPGSPGREVVPGILGHAIGNGGRRIDRELHDSEGPARGGGGDWNRPDGSEQAGRGMVPGPCNGHWAGAEWIACTDGKARPTEPGIYPLAHGVPGRVGRLRGYGNAIVPQVAAAFIRVVMDELDARRAA